MYTVVLSLCGIATTVLINCVCGNLPPVAAFLSGFIPVFVFGQTGLYLDHRDQL